MPGEQVPSQEPEAIEPLAPAEPPAAVEGEPVPTVNIPESQGPTTQEEATVISLPISLTLTVLNDPYAGKKLPVGEKFSIGRSESNELVLDLPEVSRQHAVIECQAGICTVTDLGSANGTFVNGARILQPTLLKSGDTITIGGVMMKVE
jgi:pSer/pThr/pTyr-binding forkhead associated (FHA) protein